MRTQDDIKLIMKLAGEMQFFQDLKSKQINIQGNLISKLCKMMTVDHKNKGQAVFY